jgi:ABC-type nitrate/sulfonate/bicarbonate transport system substrate-binding protein
MPRRALLLLAAGIAVAGCGRADTDRPDLPARVVLEAPAGAQHVGLYVAAVRGYDEAEGVTLRLTPAAAPASGPRLLRAGKAQFAVMDLNLLAREREAGHDLVAVMALVQKPVAAWARRALGRPVDVAGAPRYPELVLVATRGMITTEPSLIRATVAAVRRGYEEELLDPEATADVLLTRARRLHRSTLLAELARVDGSFTGPGGRVGAFDPVALRAWARWAVRAGVVRRAPDVTLAFSPPR